MKSKSYLFTYCYEQEHGGVGIGSVTITQERYAPINQSVIDDAVRIARNLSHIPDERKICPLAFHRFEDEEVCE